MRCVWVIGVLVLLATTSPPQALAGELRLVALLGCPGPAHRQWVTPLLAQLAARGHEVDVVELYPEREPREPRAGSILALQVRSTDRL